MKEAMAKEERMGTFRWPARPRLMAEDGVEVESPPFGRAPEEDSKEPESPVLT